MSRPTRPRHRAWLAVLVAVLVAAASAGGWLLTRDTSQAVSSSTATIATETVEETVSASGTVEPARTADLDFEVGGTVTRTFVEVGDTVRTGERLAAVDDAALVATRSAAAASLEAAVAQLADDQDAGASDVQVAADQAAVVVARADLVAARADVAAATLRATIAGTLVAFDLQAGDVVGSSGRGAAAGTTTSSTTSATSAPVSIVSAGRFVVEATVAAADVASLEKGLAVSISPSGVSEPVDGRLTEIGLVAESSSSGAAVFPVTIAVSGTRDDLYAGTSADASIVVSSSDVLTVPTRALETADGATYVDLVTDDGTSRTAVETGETYGMSTEVLSGLVAGDVVEVPGFTPPSGGSDGEQGQVPDFGGGTPPDFGGQMPGGMPQ
ncbi:MAG: secretion protein HlyD [Actinobacteria bacterium]|nr:secretion protein HlyD [Actinomycetota bacterium]